VHCTRTWAKNDMLASAVQCSTLQASSSFSRDVAEARKSDKARQLAQDHHFLETITAALRQRPSFVRRSGKARK